MLHAFSRLAGGRRRFMKERLERHADDVRRPAPETAGCSPQRTTERRRQTDRDLIVHEEPPNACTAIVVRRIAAGNVPVLLVVVVRPMCVDVAKVWVEGGARTRVLAPVRR